MSDYLDRPARTEAQARAERLRAKLVASGATQEEIELSMKSLERVRSFKDAVFGGPVGGQ